MTDFSRPNPLQGNADAALDYLGREFAVVPLNPPQHPKPKLPHHILGRGWSYEHDREGRPFVGMTSEATAADWWGALPESNVGIITGTPSSLFVIDCDRHAVAKIVAGNRVTFGEVTGVEDGIANFHQWAADNGVSLDGVPCAETAGGGLHYMWRCEGEVPRKRDGWLPAVDFKGTGTYVAAPPSRTATGVYRWRVGLDGLSEAPSALLAAVEAPRVRSFGVGGGGGSAGGLPSNDWFIENGLGAFTGSRDQDAYRLAWRLLGQPADVMTYVLYRAWERADQKDHPFTWDDVLKCVESARARRVETAVKWAAGGVL